MHEQSFNFIIRSLRTVWKLCEFIVIWALLLPTRQWMAFGLGSSTWAVDAVPSCVGVQRMAWNGTQWATCTQIPGGRAQNVNFKAKHSNKRDVQTNLNWNIQSLNFKPKNSNLKIQNLKRFEAKEILLGPSLRAPGLENLKEADPHFKIERKPSTLMNGS